jgi:hypothetical protein
MVRQHGSSRTCGDRTTPLVAPAAFFLLSVALSISTSSGTPIEDALLLSAHASFPA